MGAHFEALIEDILVAPLDSRDTQVGFNLISVQVCLASFYCHTKLRFYFHEDLCMFLKKGKKEIWRRLFFCFSEETKSRNKEMV